MGDSHYFRVTAFFPKEFEAEYNRMLSAFGLCERHFAAACFSLGFKIFHRVNDEGGLPFPLPPEPSIAAPLKTSTKECQGRDEVPAHEESEPLTFLQGWFRGRKRWTEPGGRGESSSLPAPGGS